MACLTTILLKFVLDHSKYQALIVLRTALGSKPTLMMEQLLLQSMQQTGHYIKVASSPTATPTLTTQPFWLEWQVLIGESKTLGVLHGEREATSGWLLEILAVFADQLQGQKADISKFNQNIKKMLQPRIELGPKRWQRSILPLNYCSFVISIVFQLIYSHKGYLLSEESVHFDEFSSGGSSGTPVQSNLPLF